MKVSCPTCDSKYTIADDKVTGRKVKVRCKSCGGQILVDGTAPAGATAESTEADASGAGDDQDSARLSITADPETFDATHGKEVAKEPVAAKPAAKEPAKAMAAAKGLATAKEPAKAAPPSKEAPLEPTAGPSDDIVWSVNVSETDERSLTTEQLVEAHLKGELEGEVYVWHDGMDDWKLITDLPELVSAIEAKQARPAPAKFSPKASASALGGASTKAIAEKSSPRAASSPVNETPDKATTLPKKTTPIALGKAAEALKAKAAAKNASKSAEVDSSSTSEAALKPAAAEKKAATLPTAKRPQTAHDLFAAASQKSDAEDVEVPAADTEEADKKLGARNESSVLFSLDALKAGITSPQTTSAPKAAAGRKGPPQAPKKKLEDLMGGAEPAPLIPGVGAGPLMLSSNQSLLTAPAPPPPKPEPVKPVTASSVSALATETPETKKKSKVLVIAAVAAVVVIGGVAAALMGGGSDKDKTVASAAPEPSAVPAAVAPVQTAQPAVEQKPTEAVASASAAPSTPAAPSAAVAAVAGQVKSGTGAPGAKTSEVKKDVPKKEEPSGPVSTGVSSFNKDSAIQALNVAAAQTSSCKNPDGPTGTGKVQITFAPSGRVTTAMVMGPPFAGTSVGGCVSSVFRRARVPAFSGDPVTVSKSFKIIP